MYKVGYDATILASMSFLTGGRFTRILTFDGSISPSMHIQSKSAGGPG